MTQDPSLQLHIFEEVYVPFQLTAFKLAMADDPQKLLCWVVCAYRKPGLSEEEYHKYVSEVHAPLVKDLLVQYGIIKWSMVVCPDSTFLRRLTAP